MCHGSVLCQCRASSDLNRNPFVAWNKVRKERRCCVQSCSWVDDDDLSLVNCEELGGGLTSKRGEQ